MNGVPVLELKGLTKLFGGLAAVNDVSFKVREGGISGLIGPNGAGKTTVFNLITGVYKVTEGQILYQGKPIHNQEPYKIACGGVTRTFQNIRLFKELSVFDNVYTACHLSANYNLFESVFRLPRYWKEDKLLKEQARSLLQIMGLEERQELTADNLPYGLQRRLEITRALALKPKLLLLDEPAAGMNPDETEQLMRLIVEVRKMFDLSVLVIEHHMDLIMGICEHIHVLSFGCTLADGSAEEVANDPKVVEAYLGAEEEK
ncbi:MAG TPA: ABC transporter ATP-binding protein [Holophaga sp.]|nr:ABC transporter ATP-binding protein [Holophaga sp.]HPS66988.1 ABC transporter ATP-binding protein [Holophaga sp.]